MPELQDRLAAIDPANLEAGAETDALVAEIVGAEAYYCVDEEFDPG